MGTRSSIVNVATNQHIYCHFDGYPEHMLPALNSILSSNTGAELVAMGDASCLDKSLVDSVFYARDRQEDLAIGTCDLTTIDGVTAFVTYLKNSDMEYVYFINQDNSITSLSTGIAKDVMIETVLSMLGVSK